MILNPMAELKSKGAIPSFLIKTYDMIDSEQFSELIGWSSNGSAFIVFNQTELAQKVLPNFFKHRNYPSFLRQLNMYNFKKTKNEYGFSEFRHKWFRKGLKSLLQYIKRRNQDDQEEKIDLNLKEYDIDSYKKDHLEMKKTIETLIGGQQKISQDVTMMIYQSNELTKESQDLTQVLNLQPYQQVKQMDCHTSKKFDRLGSVVQKIASGIENVDICKYNQLIKIESKLNQLFTQALLGEESQAQSEMNTQAGSQIQNLIEYNNSVLATQSQDNLYLNRLFMDVLSCSNNNSPYPGIDITSPYYSMILQKMHTNAFTNLIPDQNLFMQLNQLHYNQQYLALPPTIQNQTLPQNQNQNCKNIFQIKANLQFTIPPSPTLSQQVQSILNSNQQ